MDIKGKLAVARLMVYEEDFLCWKVLSTVRDQEKVGLGSVRATRRGVLLYDPAVVEKWTVPRLTAVLLHEAYHLACSGLSRRTRRSRRWLLSKALAEPNTIKGDCHERDG